MTPRRVLALAASLTVAGLVAATTVTPASARTASGAADRCLGGGAIPIGSLAAAVHSGCSLVGRMVTDGRISVMVPPVGMSVAGDGLGTHGEVRGLTVTNTGTTVRAVRDSAGATSLGRTSSARRGSPPACKDRTSNLEGPKWKTGLRYHVNLQGMPGRLHQNKVVKQIRIANGNMRKGRNTCGKPHLKTPASHFVGRTKAKPNIGAGGPSCRRGNSRNVVGFGNLPGGLLGWTCYWFFGSRMAGSDMLIDNGPNLVTNLPKNCTNKWDFEGTVTHEWGHAYGLAHTGSGHDNLTMQHILSPCSTYARTLGLGDWIGMNKMYGHRH
jgi:hypothetical protein